MRGTRSIQKGGFNDPVARSLRNQRNAAAAPSPDEVKARRAIQEMVVKRLSLLADEGVYLKDREAVQDFADDRDWDKVARKAANASSREWNTFISRALSKTEDADD